MITKGAGELKNLVLYMLAALLVGVVLAIPSNVEACSCVPPSENEDERARATVVFSGKVASVREQESPDDYPSKRVVFDVTQMFKGAKEPQLVIRTGWGSGDCGFEFEEGREYKVYAHEVPLDKGAKPDLNGETTSLETTICDETEELTAFGDDNQPVETAAPRNGQAVLAEEQKEVPSYWWIIIGGVVAGVVLIARQGKKKAAKR
ncbi:hypothetical protein [Planococcus sp. YIM B11945]|uniref:hypothetical protein n=1 Tax=Planococcus sp. YIM B11945 TaxID=3435410 RepID=UPI003D7D080F